MFMRIIQKQKIRKQFIDYIMFNKIGSQTKSLFNKGAQTIPPLFRKLDKSLQRVSSFAQPVLKNFGFDNLSNAVDDSCRIHAPVSYLRRKFS